ncbi:MAG: hypothetical protein H0V17_27660 [Deltaproteobacteria bacterium]|nr:hypothetical protein [Deltaproteobacteria bacterium]
MPARGEDAVRPEYQALVEGYPSLLRQFGVELSAIDVEDLGVLMSAIEHVDRVLDALPRAADRADFARVVVSRLDVDACDVDRDGIDVRGVDARLVTSLHALREVAVRRGVREVLARLTAETLANTERMRAVRDRATYLACIEREGALCNELALLIVPLPSAPSAFLRAIAAPANLMDKLLDLRRDHRNGEAAVDPSIGTHAWIAARMVRFAWAAARLHPSPLRFTAWGVGWLVRMARVVP